MILSLRRKRANSIFLLGGFGVPNWGDELILDKVLDSPLFQTGGIDHAYVATASCAISSRVHRNRSNRLSYVDAHFQAARMVQDDLADLDPERIRSATRKLIDKRTSFWSSMQARLLLDAVEESKGVHLCGGGYLFDAWVAALGAIGLVVFAAKEMGKPVTASGISPVARTDAGLALLGEIIDALDVLDVRDRIDPRFFDKRVREQPEKTWLSLDDAMAYAPTQITDQRPEQVKIHIQLPPIPEPLDKIRDDHFFEVVSRVTKSFDATCVFINHVGPDKKDWVAAANLAERLERAGARIDWLDLSLATPEEGLSAFATAHIAIVGRYHAMIGHLLNGVPTVSYDNGGALFNRHRSAFPLVHPDLLHVSNFADIDETIAFVERSIRGERDRSGFTGDHYAKAQRSKDQAYKATLKAWSASA